ncbi:hypothetical protein B7R21_19505 [Subtercola boreus]|uniref:Xylose isomerase-like TIM barrel domain-containing protein n=1 Tax=Subtercola boreus TaxID=120213 RepID=A0A3E0V9V1_9MICO|nr:sugar phosphate isomerase/epimerase family protein [Subtercola boreus]RFA06582.1 hypothetical protein B7R21_19505 [Subtercola boreus]
MATTLTAVPNRDLLATCWTWSGDAAPGRGDETSPVDLRTRIEAVAAAGWRGIGFVHADLLKAKRDIGLPEVRSILDSVGLEIVELEFLTDWWTTGERRRTSDEWRRLLFEATELLGSHTMKVSGDLSEAPVDLDTFATALDQLATEAREYGTRIAVEPMPMNNLGTLENGVKLVTSIGNSNLGLCVDVWHVHRGGTAYSSLPDLLDIRSVFVVELDDSLESISGASIWEDAIDARLNPGEGEFDVPGFIAAMVQTGWTGHWGVEMISESHRQLSITDAVTGAFRASEAAFDSADRILQSHRFADS